MKLLTKELEKQLDKNAQLPEEERKVVVKFFTPDAGATWWISERDPTDPDRLFGLCDLGLGFPELGYVSLNELRQLRGPLNLPIERDMYWDQNQLLGELADKMRNAPSMPKLCKNPFGDHLQ
jgi:hypothetical protein|tara:strand:- start:5341 stop:5706 length:366 start_codon:yes stop_codon:yes gene_type:complete